MKSNYILNYAFGIITLTFILSCKQDEKIKVLNNSIESNLNKEILYPDSLEVYNPFENYKEENVLVPQLKIITSVNASCATCVSYINDWHSFSEELISKDISIPIVPIFYSDDDFQLLFYSCEESRIPTFNFPFYLDYKDEFSNLNTFVTENDSFKTMLIGKDNKILLIGSPLESEKIKELYLQQIRLNR